MNETPRDLQPFAWTLRRSGWFTTCPTCRHATRRIIVIARGQYVCPKCREAAGLRAPAVPLREDAFR